MGSMGFTKTRRKQITRDLLREIKSPCYDASVDIAEDGHDIRVEFALPCDFLGVPAGFRSAADFHDWADVEGQERVDSLCLPFIDRVVRDSQDWTWSAHFDDGHVVVVILLEHL